MNRDELLEVLAMRLEGWPDFNDGEFPLFNAPGMWATYKKKWECMPKGGERQISKLDYIARRDELINEPSDDKAPPWAACKAQDSTGAWHWFSDVPVAMDKQWDLMRDGSLVKASQGAIPAGHDWRSTFTPVMKNLKPGHAFKHWFFRPEPRFEMVLDEWDGTGIPPDGTECEYRIGSSTRWHRCVIKAVCKGQGAIVTCDAAAYGEQYLSVYDHPYPAEFRPIKTPEQRAQDDAVAAMIEHAPWSDENADDIELCEAIYLAVRDGKVPGVKVRDETLP